MLALGQGRRMDRWRLTLQEAALKVNSSCGTTKRQMGQGQGDTTGP